MVSDILDDFCVQIQRNNAVALALPLLHIVVKLFLAEPAGGRVFVVPK